MNNKCTKFRNYRPYTAKPLGTWKMFDNATDNHTDIEVPLYDKLRFHEAKKCWLPHHWVNSSHPSVAYMRQWIWSALVHIMACRLFGTKPLSEPMLEYCEKVQWNSNENTKVFTHENGSDNIVCEMAAISFRGDEFKPWITYHSRNEMLHVITYKCSFNNGVIKPLAVGFRWPTTRSIMFGYVTTSMPLSQLNQDTEMRV